MDIVIVGGGATGVEIAGALAEMKRNIISKDYPEITAREIDIHLVHGNERVLNTMSPEASAKSEKFLRELGVTLWLGKVVKDFDGENVLINDGSNIRASKVIWAAGITGNTIDGLPADMLVRGNRIKVNAFNQVEGLDNVFALGDIAMQCSDPAWPEGHPQVAQVAIQQANLLGQNILRWQKQKAPKPFKYKDLGSMATIGRHRAVADLPFIKFQGTIAWFAWLFVHLFAILGAKNKLFIFLNWVWNYLTYDQSLRLVIKPWKRNQTSST